ncbi:hypothetical protein BSPWISOXPB_9519 [uncultured Gammaproteobacteria bacterium]|nr:hypothetical protein BSPWISOXPB_9519 [uncultured Gammaproteobacteria bacterium]
MQTTLNNQLTSRIDNNTLTHTYQYDANGNQTQSTGNNARIIEYTPFNKTKKLTTQTTNGTEVNETTYDANNNRIIQKPTMIQAPAPIPDKITYHINKGYTVIHTTDNQKTKSSSIDITSLLMVKSLPPMIKP